MADKFVAMEDHAGAVTQQQSSHGKLLAALLAVLAVLGGLFYWLFSGPTLPAKPDKDIFVVDEAKLISKDDRRQMLALGHDLNQRCGAQLVVVTVDALDGTDIKEYSKEVFNTWGIGSKEKNNGVLLLIAKNDRKFRIQIGTGLEQSMPGSYTSAVLDSMKPAFRQGDYSPAILQAYCQLAGKLYTIHGLSPAPELAALTGGGRAQAGQAQPQAPPAEEDDELDFDTVVGVVILLAITGVVMFVARKIVFGILGLLGSGWLYHSVFGRDGDNDDDDDGGFFGGDDFGGGDSDGGGSDGGW